MGTCIHIGTLPTGEAACTEDDYILLQQSFSSYRLNSIQWLEFSSSLQVNYNSQAQHLDMNDIALQLEVVENKDMVNTEQHAATENNVAPLKVPEWVVRGGLLWLHVRMCPMHAEIEPTQA